MNNSQLSDGEKIPVFRIKPKNKSNICKIKYVGTVNNNDELTDEVVIFDKPLHPEYQEVGKNAIKLHSIGSYNMIGGLYLCNIVGSHIVYSCRYPLMYLTIEYERPMVSGSLFQIFYSIDINKNEKKNIKNINKYVNLEFSGKWIKHIDCDEDLKKNYERYLCEMLETEAMTLFYKSNDIQYIELRNKMKDTESILKWVDLYIKNERVFYDSIINDQETEFISIPNTRDKLTELCLSHKFYKFMRLAMNVRDINRRKEYGLDENAYSVPTSYTKLDDIQNKMIEDNEIVYD